MQFEVVSVAVSRKFSFTLLHCEFETNLNANIVVFVNSKRKFSGFGRKSNSHVFQGNKYWLYRILAGRNSKLQLVTFHFTTMVILK